MTLEEDKALSNADYWDNFYAKSANAPADPETAKPTHEWFRSFSALEPFFRDNLFSRPGCTPQDNPQMLHLGSGDSVVPVELAARGYRRQLCVDFSTAVVAMMSERHSKVEGGGIEWRHMDVRNMDSLEDKSVQVAFDKGTLDAMIHGSPWSPPEMVRNNTRAYLREVHRVLKDDGVFLYITFRQPHFMRPLLTQDEDAWDLDMKTLAENGSLDYYGFVITKKKKKQAEEVTQ